MHLEETGQCKPYALQQVYDKSTGGWSEVESLPPASVSWGAGVFLLMV